MHTLKFSKIIIVGLFISQLVGCALSPKTATARVTSDELLSKQFVVAEQALATAPQGERAVLFIGSAQHSQSLAFQGDVLLAQKRLKAINPKLQSIILSNEIQTSQLIYPFATLHTLTQTFDRVAALSKKYPLTVVVLISTHGNVDVLSSNVANEYYTHIQSKHLQPWLDALGNTPTAVILSACYSGSFLPALSAIDAGQRMVLTAAAANRNSFGCSYQSENTHFIGALFGPEFDPGKTWRQNFEAAKLTIQKKEIALGLAPASNPQSSIPAVLARVSVAEFIKP
jgi:hypothetical protein